MTEFLFELVLISLIILVLLDYWKSRAKTEDVPEKKHCNFVFNNMSSAVSAKREYSQNKIRQKQAFSANSHAEKTSWEREYCGNNYDHDKLRKAAEKAMKIKEQNRCEMNRISKSLNENEYENINEKITDIMEVVCELIRIFKK